MIGSNDQSAGRCGQAPRQMRAPSPGERTGHRWAQTARGSDPVRNEVQAYAPSQYVAEFLVSEICSILPVCRTCGPRHKSMSGPQRYTVVVGVVTRSLMMRSLNLLYANILSRFSLVTTRRWYSCFSLTTCALIRRGGGFESARIEPREEFPKRTENIRLYRLAIATISWDTAHECDRKTGGHLA